MKEKIGKERKLTTKLGRVFLESYKYRLIMDSYARGGKDEEVNEYCDKYMKTMKTFWKLATKEYKLDTEKYNYVVDYDKMCILTIQYNTGVQNK